MKQFPLLDLQSAWQDAHRTLQEIQDMAETLYAESEGTWKDMHRVVECVVQARAHLILPAGILAGIAKDAGDWAAMEAHADA